MTTTTKKAPAKTTARKTPANKTAARPGPLPAAATDSLGEQLMLTAFVDVTRIAPNTANIRHDLGDVSDLAESIRHLGILEPLIVYRPADPEPGIDYVLIAGHRRRAAAELAGVGQVPVIVRAEPDRAELFELMLAENLDPLADFVPFPEHADLADQVMHKVEQVPPPVPVGHLSAGTEYWYGNRARIHTVCPGHLELVVPWQRNVIAACTQPHLHEPGGGPTWQNLEVAYRSAQTRDESKESLDRLTGGTPPAVHAAGWRGILGAETAELIESTVGRYLDDINDGFTGILLALEGAWELVKATPEGDPYIDVPAIVDAIGGYLRDAIDQTANEDQANKVPDMVLACRWLLTLTRDSEVDPPAALVLAVEGPPAEDDVDAEVTSP